MWSASVQQQSIRQDAKVARRSVLQGLDFGGHATGKRITNVLSIGVPFTGSLAAIYWIATHSVTWIEVSCFLIFYLLSGIGIGVGFHRYFTHQAIRASLPLKVALGFMGSLAFQGSVLRWVADHRRHHRYTDEPGDTHSPLTTHERYFGNRLSGLLHAHLSWMFDPVTTDYEVYAPDLLKDRLVMAFHYAYWPLCVASLALPFAYGYWLGGMEAAVGCFLIGGCLRVSALHNFIWAINSIGHTYGSQDASTKDSSRNNFVLAMLTFGEGWHNNHHAKPRSAFNDWKWFQFDLNGILIRLCVWARLASNPVRPEKLDPSRARIDAIRFDSDETP